MTELQAKLVEMLAFFHRFCIEKQLRYYIVAGTMLGAVRHNGFIPWDDDIDVGMPRADYEKLKEIVKKDNYGKYRFEFPLSGNREYSYISAKMYDTETTFIEKIRKPIKRGIYIDIFPLDGVGNTEEEAKKNYKQFYRYYTLYLMTFCGFLKRRSIKKNMAVLLGRIISPLFVSRDNLVKKIDSICKENDFDDSRFVWNLLGGSEMKKALPKEAFGKPTPISFENIEVLGVEDPDMYLKALYGDYMKLPPVEKRVSLHDLIYCNLKKSYLEN